MWNYVWYACKYIKRKPDVEQRVGKYYECDTGIIKSRDDEQYFNIIDDLIKKKGYTKAEIKFAWNGLSDKDEYRDLETGNIENGYVYTGEDMKHNVLAGIEDSKWEAEMNRRIVLAEKGEATKHRGLIPPVGTDGKMKILGCECSSSYEPICDNFKEVARDLFTLFPHEENDMLLERPDVVKVDGFWFTVTELRKGGIHREIIFHELDAPSLGLEGKIACRCEVA